MNKTTYAAVALLPSRNDSPEFYEPYAGAARDYEACDYHPPATQRQQRRTSWLYVPTSNAAWAFLGLVFVQAAIGLGLEGYVFGKFTHSVAASAWHDAHAQAQARTIPTYLSLFIFGLAYEILLAYDALRLENTIQVAGICLYNAGLLIEAAVQYDQIRDTYDFLRLAPQPQTQPQPLIGAGFLPAVRGSILAVPVVLGVGTLGMSYVAWKLYKEYQWSIFENISVDLKVRRRYLTYQIYIALLKFDFFFFLSFTIQFLVVVPETKAFETYVTIIAIPVTVVLLFLAAYWTRTESRAGLVVIICVYLAGLAYFTFKLVRIYSSPPAREYDYRPARRSLTTFAALTIALLLATLVCAALVMANFGTGLKPHVASRLMQRGPGERRSEGRGRRGDLVGGGGGGQGEGRGRQGVGAADEASDLEDLWGRAVPQAVHSRARIAID